MKRAGDRWLILLCAILGIVSIFIWQPWHQETDTKIAVITQRGQVVETINLSTITEPYEIELKDSAGNYNRVRLEKGRIKMIDANCPSHNCVNQGWIQHNGQSIICLPHQLVITIHSYEDHEIDGVVR